MIPMLSRGDHLCEPPHTYMYNMYITCNIPLYTFPAQHGLASVILVDLSPGLILRTHRVSIAHQHWGLCLVKTLWNELPASTLYGTWPCIAWAYLVFMVQGTIVLYRPYSWQHVVFVWRKTVLFEHVWLLVVLHFNLPCSYNFWGVVCLPHSPKAEWLSWQGHFDKA